MVRTSSSLRRLLDIVDYLVDDRVGVIRHVGEIPREAGAPDFFHFHAQACDTSAFCHQKNFASSGGASPNRGMAMAKAVGEAIERYCAAIYDAGDLPLTSFKSAQFHCIPPHKFALYSSSNIPDQVLPMFHLRQRLLSAGLQRLIRWRKNPCLSQRAWCTSLTLMTQPQESIRLPNLFQLVLPAIAVGKKPRCQPSLRS